MRNNLCLINIYQNTLEQQLIFDQTFKNVIFFKITFSKNTFKEKLLLLTSDIMLVLLFGSSYFLLKT